jgi:hypothetical protein
MDISLSGKQVLELLDYKANLIQYSDLHKIKSIDELLGPHRKCVLLYLTSANYGHYCCVWEYNNTIFFFDSYGSKPDTQLNFVPKDMKEELNSNHNYLIRLLYESGKNVEYNQYQLQSREPNITTCGRWCCSRLRFPEISIEDYHDIFKQSSRYMSNDELITLLVPA